MADTFPDAPVFALIIYYGRSLHIVYAVLWDEYAVVDMDEQHFAYEHIVRAERYYALKLAFYIDGAFLYHGGGYL